MTWQELVHPVLDPVMIAGGLGLGISWWQRHAVRAPRPEPEVPLVVELQESWVEFIWNTRVAGNEEHGLGALPRTQLVSVQRLEQLDGWEAVIQLVPGKQSTATAVAATDMVTSAYELEAGAVIIEPTRDQKRHQARLQIITGRSPLYDVTHWVSRTMQLGLDGLARIGTYADGAAAHVRFWTRGSGAVNMLVAGAQGSGKSAFMNLLLATSMRARYRDADGQERQLVDTYLGCGQRGHSVPDWARCRALRWMATTPQELVWMVGAFRQQMIERSEYLANLEWTDEQGRVRHGLSFFDPVKAGMPYAQLVLDEAAAAIAEFPLLAEWLYDIARRGRKNGMRIVLATQSPSADELGGNTNLRAMLAAGGVVVFRVGDGNHGSMAFPSGECGNPAEIPVETPDRKSFEGAGYVAGPDNRSRALMRTLLVPDSFGEAQAAQVWPLHPVDARGGGETMARFWDRQEARWRGENPEAAEVDRLFQLAQESATAAAAGQVAPADAAPQGPVSPDGKPALRPLLALAIAEAEEDGRTASTAELKKAAAAWWSEKSVGNELAAMFDAGIVTKPGKGQWKLVDPRAQAA